LSFDIAEKHNVVPLLEAEDIIMLPKPDKMSIITYVSQFYHAFAKESIRATSNQRLNPKAAEYLANKPADSAAGGIASKFENAGSTRTPELQKKPILSDSRNLNTLQTGSPAASGRKWAEDLKRKEEESKKAEEEKKLKLAEAQKKIREDQILRRKQEEEQDRIEKDDREKIRKNADARKKEMEDQKRKDDDDDRIEREKSKKEKRRN